MISGRFNLMKSFQSKEVYFRYYKSKFVTIFVPFCLAAAVIVWSEHQFESNLVLYIKKCIEAFFNVNASTHLWFMYVMIGLLVSAPFLQS